MRGPKFKSGVFVPTNPEKYIGTYPIRYRSSWELTFMRKCDLHPDIIEWASESIQIPYKHPIKQQGSIYIPDFIVHYKDKNGKKHVEIIEIKPMSQTDPKKARSLNEKVCIAINSAKWQAAHYYARRSGATFRVITEEQLYQQPLKSSRKKLNRR